jgi:beta-galactosidase
LPRAPSSRTHKEKSAPSAVARARRVKLLPEGLGLGEADAMPLWCGAMHYWRHAPEEWEAGLDAIRELGLRLVDTYVPWGIHEVSAGEYDFGERNRSLDVSRFLSLAAARGLKVILRPGPHINAELTYFGLPERIAWDPGCQARTPRGNPVILPMVPLAFPVPSYASEAFHQEAARWFLAVGARLSPLRHPDGPIALVQIDNEGAMYFRDAPYDQDYHADAIALFRGFLRAKYNRNVRALRAAWSDPKVAFASVTPPHRFDAHGAEDLPRHLDWMEFHEHLITHAMGRFARALDDAGLGELPTMHNFPLGESATPLNAGRMTEVIDLIGLDYYHRATPGEHMTILRRTTELASHSEGRGVAAFGAEVGAGFPPFFAPLDEKDSLYTLMCGLAYGLRGFNLYMAVERDRWVGAPIDRHGRRRPFGDAYAALSGALDRLKFHSLRRRAPVRLVVPRALRRLARATHAFGPITPAIFNIIGAGFRESCLEEDLGLGLGSAVTIAGEGYVRAFERALSARGVPFAYAGGDSMDVSVTGASWIVCATAGGVKEELFAKLRALAGSGARVTIGPHVPTHDGAMRPLSKPRDLGALELEPLDDAARADALVARRIEELSLPTYPIDPPHAFVCVHEDSAGTPKAAFVMNPTAESLVARVGIVEAAELVDAIGEGRVSRSAGAFEIELPPRTARLFVCSN